MIPTCALTVNVSLIAGGVVAGATVRAVLSGPEHFDQVVDVKVLLTVEKQKEKEKRQRAECNIHVKGNDLFAESSHGDLYAAVDELVDKMDRQVVRHKDRLQDYHHEAAKRELHA